MILMRRVIFIQNIGECQMIIPEEKLKRAAKKYYLKVAHVTLIPLFSGIFQKT